MVSIRGMHERFRSRRPPFAQAGAQARETQAMARNRHVVADWPTRKAPTRFRPR